MLMDQLHRILSLCLLFALVSPVWANSEVHVVSVGQGHQTDDFYALPEVNILVDRPEHYVTLVLLDGGDVHWKVEATAGTMIGEVVRGGKPSETSTVSLFGIPLNGARMSGLPHVFQTQGSGFRALVDILTGTHETERIASFRAFHNVDEAAIRITDVDTITRVLSRDYLRPMVQTSDDLPVRIRDRLDSEMDQPGPAILFDEAGITLTGETGIQRFPVTRGVPEIVLPADAVYDPRSQVIYAVTRGGVGYLYEIDVKTGDWAVVTSMEEYDAAALLFVPDQRLLVTTGAFSRPGEIRIFGLEGLRSSRFFHTTSFPGLTDLFDYGNQHAPPLIPLVYSHGWLLVEAQAGPENGTITEHPFRTYAVNMQTGEVRLLRFGDR